MSCHVVVVTGTGTGIGKTHVAEALLLGWRALGRTVVGFKPVESGVGGEQPTDQERLGQASSFHVKHPGVALRDPVSPHLAARREGRPLTLDALTSATLGAIDGADVAVIELAGGLFSPLGPGISNADLASRLAPDRILLVAPDRLGVLHDIFATERAASTLPLRITAVVLVAPEVGDASTGTNAEELDLLGAPPVLAVVPRGTPAALARAPGFERLLRALG